MTWATAGPAFAGAAVACVAVIAIAVLVIRRFFLIATVVGHSMRPTLSPGDRLLVRRRGLRFVRRGDLVVLAHRPPADADPSADDGRYLVKRAAAVPGDAVPPGISVPASVVPAERLVALGDNKAQSYDSRAAGFFRSDEVVGLVLRRVGRGDAEMKS